MASHSSSSTVAVHTAPQPGRRIGRRHRPLQRLPKVGLCVAQRGRHQRPKPVQRPPRRRHLCILSIQLARLHRRGAVGGARQAGVCVRRERRERCGGGGMLATIPAPRAAASFQRAYLSALPASPLPPSPLQYLAASCSTKLSLCCAARRSRCSASSTPSPWLAMAGAAPALAGSAAVVAALSPSCAAAAGPPAGSAGRGAATEALLLPREDGASPGLASLRTSSSWPSAAEGEVGRGVGMRRARRRRGAGRWRRAAAHLPTPAAWRWLPCGRATAASTPGRRPWHSGPAPSSGSPRAGRYPAPPAAGGTPAGQGAG